jgi:hypothetical protein
MPFSMNSVFGLHHRRRYLFSVLPGPAEHSLPFQPKITATSHNYTFFNAFLNLSAWHCFSKISHAPMVFNLYRNVKCSQLFFNDLDRLLWTPINHSRLLSRPLGNADPCSFNMYNLILIKSFCKMCILELFQTGTTLKSISTTVLFRFLPFPYSADLLMKFY